MDAPKRILIAEDDYAIALALKTIVGGNIPCELDMASNGGEAWDLLQKKNFDLVISDWNMPVKTGAQLRLDMEQDPRLSAIPFIMLTARADKDSVVQAIKAGITDYVHKPFDRAKLIEKIQTLLSADLDFDAADGIEATAPKPRKIVEEIAAKLKQDTFNFPTMSNLANQVSKLIEEKDAGLTEIAHIIRDDPIIAARLIAIANTAMYRGAKKIISLEEAIGRLGLKETVNYLWVFSNAGLFNAEERRFGDLLLKLREHSLATAICARLVAKHLGWPHCEDLFFMGLLHDIGMMLVLQILEELAKQEPIEDAAMVEDALNKLHEKFGALLLSRWGFPNDIQTIALYHDRPAEAPSLTQELVLVHVANRLTRRLGFSLVKDDGTLVADMPFADRLGLDEEAVPEILETVKTSLRETSVLAG
jgi:putative nucleotidyltransferase with HDIG domain